MSIFFHLKIFFFSVLLLLVSAGVFFVKKETLAQTFEGRVQVNTIVTHDPVKNFSLAIKGNTDQFYYSSVIALDFPSTALGFSWNKESEGTLEMKFFQEDKWFRWETIESGHFASKNEPERLFSDLVFTDSAEKVLLRSKDKDFLKSVEIIYINASYSSPGRDFNIASYSNGLSIIKRSEWGADEAYRFGVVQDEEARQELIAKGAEVRGDQIELWPHEYADVKKFVMHETAGSPGESNPEAVVRGVYHYHAKSLGWGDCGYNYILDTLGNIYECKSGGDGVVAGHVYATESVTTQSGAKVELGFNMNVGSIGISVLGNYITDTVTGATQIALAKLMEQKALDFRLDPEGFSGWAVPIVNRNNANVSEFKEAILKSGKLYRIKNIEYEFDVSNIESPKIILKNFLNFVGHKDIDYKNDPQINLEQVFFNGRKSASQSYQKKMRDGIRYDAAVVAQSASEIKLKQNESATFWVQLQNNGETAWHNYTDKKIVLSSQGESHTLETPNVEPGETTFITFSVSPSLKRAKETKIYELSMIGFDAFPKKNIEVTVINTDLAMADYAAEYQGHNFPPAFFDNATPTLKLSYRNVGKKSWKKGELILNVVENLKETRPSPWKTKAWKNDFGKFVFREEEVLPEGIATFEIPFSNLNPGNFKHRFYITRPIEQNGMALGEEKVIGSEAEVESRVDPIFGAQLVSQNIPSAILHTWNIPVKFTFKNVGLSPWKGTVKLVNLYKPKDVAVSFIDYSWVSSDIIAQQKVSVDRGKEISFSFKIDAPRTPGMYDFQYKLMVGDQVIWIGGTREQKISVRVD